MEIIEDGLEVALDDFLARRLFCVLAQRSGDGPRLSPLWFLWEDGTVWNVARLDGRSYPGRVREYPESALAVVDFEPATGRIKYVGMRGEATLEPYDRRRAGRLFEKYLGDDREAWPETFRGLDAESYRLIRFDPETVVARDQSYPAPGGGPPAPAATGRPRRPNGYASRSRTSRARVRPTSRSCRPRRPRGRIAVVLEFSDGSTRTLALA